ncbi:PucR family transcriptional regulator [Bacillus massiliigorillae]|uniref:PucR family transcriptional regulator n=1 Tax=Bacillus massiliigorillae TaxID=1243664 RepID=UPI0003A4AA80|nr:PucR family transcriptional regulator [Bacillus massiliigorillae]
MKSYITVEDILSRKHFDQIQIIAGKNGLNRLVKWVHIVEVVNIRNLLKGNELILSTAVAWKDDKERFISILQQLIESNASGLCIELIENTSPIPSEIIEIANLNKFPIILFHQEVPFVEITQDIHTLLINRQYEMISKLESYSEVLNKKLLTVEHADEILTFVQQYLQLTVVITYKNNESQVYPSIHVTEQEKLKKALNDTHLSTPSYSVATNEINVLGETYAELRFLSNERELTEYDHLILDRTSTALAQFFMRELYVDEKRRVEETEWINGWLDGEQNTEEITEYIAFHLPKSQPKGAAVCLVKIPFVGQFSPIELTYFKLYFRAILEQRGFSFFSIEKRNAIIFILLNERSSDSWKNRMKEGIVRLINSDLKLGKNKKKLLIGVGKYVEELGDIHLSYKTALETIAIQERLSNMNEDYFYDDLHIYRLISLLNRHTDLQEIVNEYLEPIISYDEKYNGNLIETLKTYLSCQGSKQETAKKLYIVRQTLYHRLQKIESLLGHDFMDYEKRLTIEFMIMSYEFLKASRNLVKKI